MMTVTTVRDLCDGFATNTSRRLLRWAQPHTSRSLLAVREESRSHLHAQALALQLRGARALCRGLRDMRAAVLLLLGALVPRSSAWLTTSQARYGAELEEIQASFFAASQKSADRSLGWLWSAPNDARSNRGLGGSITWAWDPELCTYLMTAFKEEVRAKGLRLSHDAGRPSRACPLVAHRWCDLRCALNAAPLLSFASSPVPRAAAVLQHPDHRLRLGARCDAPRLRHVGAKPPEDLRHGGDGPLQGGRQARRLVPARRGLGDLPECEQLPRPD